MKQNKSLMCTWSFITSMSRLTVGLGCWWGAIMGKIENGWIGPSGSNDAIQTVNILDLSIFRQIIRIIFRCSKWSRIFGFWFRGWFFGGIFKKLFRFSGFTLITFLHVVITVDIHACESIIHNGKVFQVQFARLLCAEKKRNEKVRK